MELLDKHLERFTKFIQKAEKEEECWLWSGAKDWDGYGIFQLNRRGRRAHRLSYELYVGDIPEGLMIRHTCDNPSCVNPKHLIPGTNQQNCDDAVTRGRSNKGTRNGRALINENYVRTIRSLRLLGASAKESAAILGITQGVVESIVAGRNWGWVK
jgi:hypothetical protein